MSAETDEEFLARIEGMVAEAKKVAFNAQVTIQGKDWVRLRNLQGDEIIASSNSRIGADHLLYEIECARGRAVRLVVERLRS